MKQDPKQNQTTPESLLIARAMIVVFLFGPLTAIAISYALLLTIRWFALVPLLGYLVFTSTAWTKIKSNHGQSVIWTLCVIGIPAAIRAIIKLLPGLFHPGTIARAAAFDGVFVLMITIIGVMTLKATQPAMQETVSGKPKK